METYLPQLHSKRWLIHSQTGASAFFEKKTTGLLFRPKWQVNSDLLKTYVQCDSLMEKMTVPCWKQSWSLNKPHGDTAGRQGTWLLMLAWPPISYMNLGRSYYISLSQISFLVYKMGRIKSALPSFFFFIKITWDDINKSSLKIIILRTFNLRKHSSCNKKPYKSSLTTTFPRHKRKQCNMRYMHHKCK